MKKIWYLYLHETALFISELAMTLNWRWLWERGGALELWADEKLYILEWTSRPVNDETLRKWAAYAEEEK